MKQTIAVLLIMSMLFAAILLPSCSDSADGSTADVTTNAETDAETEYVDSLEARQSYSDNLPERDFEGRTFAVIGDEEFVDYYTVEEMNGEVVNDSVYTRNENVASRYNVVFNAVCYSEDSYTGHAQKAVLAGDDAYQMVAGHIIYLGMSAVNDYMYDWYNLDYVDFTQPWWSDSTINDLTYKGKAFVAIGD